MSRSIALSLILLATTATAETLPQGLHYGGESRLEYITGNGSATTSLLGRLDLSYLAEGQGALDLGVAVGAESWSLRKNGGTGGDTSSIYLEAVVQGDFGLLAMGQSRTAGHILTLWPTMGGSASLENSWAKATGQGPHAALLTGGTNPGLRFDTGLGNGRMAVSLNHLDGYGNLAQVAASLPLGAVTVEASVEYLQPKHAASTLLGLRGTFGAVEAGLYHYNDQTWGSGSSTRLFGSYHLSDQLSTTVTLMKLGTVSLGGVDAKYTTEKGYFGQIGVISSSDVPDPVFNLTAGMSF